MRGTQNASVCRAADLKSNIFRSYPPPLHPSPPLCSRQSPCQYSGRHHLSGLALGPRQSPLRSRLDFAADQWDLWGQTDCHCILLCMRQKTQFACAAPHLYFTCLNPGRQQDRREESNRGRVIQAKAGIWAPSIRAFYVLHALPDNI